MSSDRVQPDKRWSTEDIDQPWTVGEAIGVAMKALRGHFGTLVGWFAALLALGIVGAGALGFAFRIDRRVAELGVKKLGSVGKQGLGVLPPSLLIVVGAMLVVLFLVLQVGAAGLVETSLAAVRDERVPPGRLGRALRRTPRFVAFSLIFFPLAVGSLGILAVPLAMAPFFLVDDELGPIAALRKSWRTTRPYLGTVWLYLIALGPLSLLGFASVILAPLTTPLHALGLAYAYVRSTGRNDLAWLPPEFATRSIRTFLKITFLTLAGLLALLVAWVRSLPTLRGAAWNLKDMLVRASTILAGVGVVLVFLALILPYVLDRLEGRRFTSFVAARHVRSQKSGFLTVISILSICGVAISSCALSSVISVMGGFSQDLKRKLLGNNAHIVIDTTSATPFANDEALLEKLRAIPGVVGATPVVHGEVMASSASNLAGVIVTGVEPKSIESVIELGHNLEVGKLDYLEHPELLKHLPANEVIGIGPGGEQYFKGPEPTPLDDEDPAIDPEVRAILLDKPDRPGIVVGRELAKTLHVYVGDEITLVSPLGDLGPMGIMPRTKRFRVAGVFYSGMYEFDATYVYTMIDVAQDYFQTGGRISAIDIKIDDSEHADRVTPLVEDVVRSLGNEDLRVRDWREINKKLFSALKLERLVTFIILSIAITVASFCIVCTLLLTVTEKGKEIAILKAVGASDGMILRTFMVEGMIIGGIGTAFGVVTGLAVCTGLSWFGLRLDPDVYYIDRLPISVNGWDFLTVAVAAFVICTLSTIYPAYAASKLRPVDGLRYE